MSAFSGQQFSNLQLQNIYKNAAAQAQQGANKAGSNLMTIYNRYLRPQQPQQSTANPTGSVVGYPTQPSDEGQPDQTDAMNQGAPPEPMAQGRLVTRPMVALLGENGPERVIPLNSNPYNKTNMPGRYGGNYGG